MTGGKPICVIGASGFVGSHVTAALLARGTPVHGTTRDASAAKTGWLRDMAAEVASDGATLTLFSASAFDKDSLAAAMDGCDGVIMCAGSATIEPETIPLMEALAENVSEACLETGIERAVFTSSTGSTNPPEGEPELKREMDHWSDPDVQLAAKKYAAVGKTRLDQTVLGKMAASDGRFRAVTINPSMITGPCYQPEPVTSLKSFAAILSGKRLADKVPNSSMSMIDVRDLAALHLAALDNPSASGRYFGVKKSWHWRDILAALEQAVPGYKMPALDPEETPVRATQFDLSRQASLGVSIRDIDEILAGLVGELTRRQMM